MRVQGNYELDLASPLLLIIYYEKFAANNPNFQLLKNFLGSSWAWASVASPKDFDLTELVAVM